MPGCPSSLESLQLECHSDLRIHLKLEGRSSSKHARCLATTPRLGELWVMESFLSRVVLLEEGEWYGCIEGKERKGCGVTASP